LVELNMNTKQRILSVAAAISLAGLATSTYAASKETQAQLQAEAKVSRSEAEKTALAEVPHGTIKDGEIEREHGALVWSFDIARPHSKNITEVQVDANSGAIARTHVETPVDQAKEAAADKKK
jgi:uncharacterized membrane protein YkoI